MGGRTYGETCLILCCGEALIDMLPRETRSGDQAFAPHVGGAVFNTAVALGRLGVPTGFFSGISTDMFGIMLERALRDAGVDLSSVLFSDRPTTLAFVGLEGGDASYLFYDENSAGRMIEPSDLPPVPAAVTAMHFSCISLVAEPCGTAYEALAAREAPRRVVMLDPNLRPGFIADRVRHEARLRRMIALADIVKLSEEDLAWFGEAGSLDDIAMRWLSAGPKLIVVTRGSRGATGWCAAGSASVAAHRVEMVDTVGAGDTFNAGLLAHLEGEGLLHKDSLAALSCDQLAAALGFAARAAAVTVSRPGADPPWRHEVEST